MTATEIITLRAPEMVSVSNFASFLELAELMTGATIVSPHREMCVALRAMHLIATKTITATSSVAKGQLISVKEGDLAEAYQSSSATVPADLATTVWGVELYSLLQMVIFCPMTRNG